VAILEEGNTISAIVHYHKHGVTVNVYFGWPIVQPKDCYELTVNGLKLELDAHFPARPVQLNITRDQLKDHDTLALLEQLFGEVFTDALQNVHRSIITALKLELSPQNRQNMARLQLDSDQSPDIIRIGCAAMFNQTLQKTQVDETHPAHSIQAFIDVFLHGDDEAEPLVA
jgi:hypothetical protein